MWGNKGNERNGWVFFLIGAMDEKEVAIRFFRIILWLILIVLAISSIWIELG